jgi:hypothetical protein
VAISGTDFKGNSRHNSGAGDRAQIDNSVGKYGQKIRDAEARRRASEREPEEYPATAWTMRPAP